MTGGECGGHHVSKNFFSKTTAEAIYKFASHQAIPNGHSTKLTHSRNPHRSHSPPTGSGSYFRLPDSTNTAPQKYRCTASRSSRTSRSRQLYNTHHNSLRCLTAWAPTRARLGSQSLSWLGLGRNMRNQARGSHNFFRLQKRVSS